MVDRAVEGVAEEEQGKDDDQYQTSQQRGREKEWNAQSDGQHQSMVNSG